MGKARLIFTEKYAAGRDIFIEMKIWQIPPSDWGRYPDRVKYRLLCLNVRTGKKLLMDNHSPKGPHVHFGDIEKGYNFESVNRLFGDFKIFILTFMEVEI